MRVETTPGNWAWHGSIPVGSRYTAGLAGQEFLDSLRDRGEIIASRCNSCDRTYVPISLFCERCFAQLDERVTVGPEGEVAAVTAAHMDLDGTELIQPQIWAAVRLDGATSVLVHRGLGDADRWSVGTRARVKLAADRQGSILDIEGFEAL